MILKAYIENYGTTAFDIVSGGVVKENFNETLDSGSINITNLSTQLELYPTQFVKLQSTDGNFTKYFIIDNFVESIENLDDGIYDYVINLASPLKLLEKVQLPNRTILHSLVSSREKIATIINQMMTLYCPKVKHKITDTTWDYQYMFTWGSLITDTKLENTDCPDLSFNAPTLREVITTLLLVVGYLPTINHRALTFIDLRATQNDFVVQNGRIYDVKRSNSIDSYVNTLQVQANNVLDTSNKVVNELLGFRDKNNVFLKHTENLKLETRFPIESINKLELSSYVQERYQLQTIRNASSDLDLGLNDANNNDVFNLPNTKLKIRSSSATIHTISYIRIKYYYDSGATTFLDHNGFNNLLLSQTPTLVLTDAMSDLTVNDNWTIISPSTSITWTYAVITLVYNGTTYTFATPQIRLSSSVGVALYRLHKKDITDIVFEQGQRKLLSTDYNIIQQNVSYDDFKNYYYLTLQYQYGGKEITGFSDNRQEFTWWGQNYAENFMEFLWKAIYDEIGSTNYSEIENSIFFPSGSIIANQVLKTNGEVVDSDLSKYSLFLFDIEYRPFNDVNIRYTKELNDIPYAIEQLDKQEASIPTLDEFSAREQDKINRLGNDVVQIHQSQASDFSYINELNTIYQDNTIFSREIAFYDDSFEVNYVATKNYVLKNYFTALQTKYRAYEYVDYNQTILRKENKKIFVYVGTHYFNADDYVIYGSLMFLNNTNTPPFLYSALLPYTLGDDTIFKYQIDGLYQNATSYNYYKNDLSIMTYKNNLVFSSQMFDSVSGGIYIEVPEVQDALGGYTQGWYINEHYNLPMICLYTNKKLSNLISNDKTIYTESDIENYINIAFKLPKMNNINTFISQPYLRYAETRDSRAKLYYKSQNEIINQTLQFEYYTDEQTTGTPYFEFTEQFININSAVFDRSKGYLMLCGFTNTTKIQEEPYSTLNEDVEYTYENYVSEIANRGVAFNLSSNFTRQISYSRYVATYLTFKVIWWDNETGQYYDIFAIQLEKYISTSNYINVRKYNSGTIRAYFSMNDTKTEKVYAVNETTGLWEQTEEIQTNTTSRLLK